MCGHWAPAGSCDASATRARAIWTSCAGLRAVGLRDFERQARVGQFELRRQALAVAQFGDLVGARRPAGSCRPLASQTACAAARSSRAAASGQLGEFARLLEHGARFGQVRRGRRAGRPAGVRR